jgi:hypothetical protein
MDSPGYFLELPDCLGQAPRRAVQLNFESGGLRGYRCLDSAELKAQGHEPLLGPVVEISLDPTAGLVGGGDNTGS